MDPGLQRRTDNDDRRLFCPDSSTSSHRAAREGDLALLAEVMAGSRRSRGRDCAVLPARMDTDDHVDP
jgi:hypothetical protein